MATRLATNAGGAQTLNLHAKIGVLGCTGRVGNLVVKEILSGHWGPGVSLAGGSVRPGLPTDFPFFAAHDPEKIFELADALIDFTAPEATRRHVWLAAKHHKPLVIGTTGLPPQDERELRDAAKEAPLLHSANMSVGINLLLALVEQTASLLGPEFDIEIAETHHRHKVDAPSGTALALGRAAQKGRGLTDAEAENFILSRTGNTGERPAGAIGFAVQRGGDVVSEHTVGFLGDGERLELTHRATDRGLFARGALRAALWLKEQPYGLYSLRDVLGLQA